MKRKLLALLAAAALMLPPTSAAFTSEDFSGGALSGITTAGQDLLVCDIYNKVIWQISDSDVKQAAGKINLAGLDGEPIGQYSDGALDTALFTQPWDITPFMDGFAVSDTEANVIRYVTDSGVYTAAGSGKAGLKNSTGTAAQFDGPTGLTTDDNGTVYIADTGNGSIRTLDNSGKVSTFVTGLVEPTGLCWKNGTLYIAETGRSRICTVDCTAKKPVVTVICGGDELDGEEYPGNFVDGPLAKARFNHPQGIAAADDGTIYVSDTGNRAIREISNGRVTTLAASQGTPLPPVKPRGILLSENTLFVTDLMARTIFTVDLTTRTFSDVPVGSWYAANVTEATRRGFISGVGNGAFAPEEAVNRGMFVVMLSAIHQRTDGSILIDGEDSFADVSDSDWFAKAVRWAAQEGIVAGFDGRFQPESNITREQLVSILYAYARIQGFDCSARADLSRYQDVDSISSYALTAMEWAVAEGILSGTSATTLSPKSNATRAQSVCMLLAAMDAWEL